MEPSTTGGESRFLLDASAIANGANLPPGRCWTTPSVVAEFRPGGATRRRLDLLLAGGLEVRAPTEVSLRRVREAATGAGSQSRLSATDVDLIALALDAGRAAVLFTDDFTMQDVARRLAVDVRSVATQGVRRTLDWSSRCVGCGRTYPGPDAPTDCPVCGSEVRAKPRRVRAASRKRGGDT